ncbi:flagellar motor switch protein FliM [Qipengyuania sp. DGS5-3]|uniref:flagellar motor switch protein FliM n=1 Tax=Qipengyuania sp. DGS5-3 TaxID=3349632 RepID=UPI0036D260A8
MTSWSKDWFGQKGWQVLGTWDAVGRPNAKDWTVLRDASRLQIKGKAMAMQSLALALLNSKKHPKYTDQDLRLMRKLASRALDDLQSRIEQSLGNSQPAASAYPIAGGASYSLLIGIVGGAQLAVECAASDLAQIIRQTFPTNQDNEDELKAREDSLLEQNVSVAASIGEASLTIEEIEKLEVGDIVMLDRAADAAVMLTVEDMQTDLPFALGEAGGKITLKLEDLS